ncbi:YARHG domain-containing protein [Chitinophaga nivalis]|uniref:YARHG domain-containing protein n=1 Tax=Chitinophaga nivalis TaxID=2991709 RepID=A0ABT3INK0_9BACT|nr:YARHG domain-containing protein [Chitinophaga nivalis]MCW3464774.1 YARHG domain-containing protein [Chitinophaga nivalis]MCW3485535.1 YARHG domain-containing protein [Chitinophaga nivalis]
MKTFYLTLFTLFVLKSACAQSLHDCTSCTTQRLKPEQIENLSIDDIRFLTNDLFARRGYRFKSGEVDSYYAEKPWYKPVKNNEDIVFNEIEKQNISLFQQRTLFLKNKREKMIAELQSLKQYVLADNTPELSRRFKYIKSTSDFQYLQKAIEKISINDINWFKHKAKYELTIDDGDFVRVYSIHIDRNKIRIQYNNQGGSTLDEHTTLYPTASNNEFAYWWDFEFDTILKFIRFDVAG